MPSAACWRVLAGPEPSAGAELLAQHVARLGPLRKGGGWLLDVLDESHLRGRGGAGFPVGRKWRSVIAQQRGVPTVAINLAEGEPASFKDRTLAALRPHLILDGAALAVETIEASRAVIYVGRAHSAALRALHAAVRERRHLGLEECEFEIVDAPDGYVSGESSALVHSLNGGPARPTAVPPRPHEAGVLGQPTLIQNAETTAHIALIARWGAGWFRQVGTETSPGTALVTILGAVARPGVLEVDRAATLGAVADAAGGLLGPAQAILLGGYFGTWIRASDAWELQLDDEILASHGTSLGCGVLAVLPAASCGVAESARILRYLAEESAGQCGPCVNGLPAIAAAMERVAFQPTDPVDVERLHRWARQVAHRGACHHPDGAIRMLLSALNVFAGDIWRHMAGESCTGVGASSIFPFSKAGQR